MTKRILLPLMLLSTMSGSVSAVELPAICTANAAHAEHDMDTMAPKAETGSANNDDLMAGMDKMNADMMIGATASDLDVAFVCSMIPHHQGAIDMARAELANGDDPWARELAATIIAAQETEIAAMLEWLETAK